MEVIDDIDKLRRHFLWVGDKALTGGKCKVKWTKTSLPKEFGSLNILNLNRFTSALCCVGFGMNGPHQIRRGWARRCLALNKIDCFLQLAPQSP
jgi:hypothetical protein